MKKTFIILTLTLVLTFALIFSTRTYDQPYIINSSDQSFMTNTVAECIVPAWRPGKLIKTLSSVSETYNIRICVEDETFYDFLIKNRINTNNVDDAEITKIETLLEKSEKPSKKYKNATLKKVLNDVLKHAPGHTWRYEEYSKTIYVYPIKDSITMKICDPFSVTNVPIGYFIELNDIIGFNKFGGAHYMTHYHYQFYSGTPIIDENITLDLNESYAWEIMDAICAQSTEFNYWAISKISLKPRRSYFVFFHTASVPFPPWDERKNDEE